MPTSTQSKRSTKNLLLSGVVHSALLATLWFTANDMRTPEPTPPETIDATILPPPVEEKPVETPAEPPKASPTVTQPAVEHSAPAKPNKNPAPNSSNDNDKTLPTDKKGTQAAGNADKTDSKDKGENKDGGSNSTGGAGNAGSGASSAKPLTNGTPVAVKPIGGFQIQYDAHVNKGDIEADGGATLTFNRGNGTYTADLSAKASVGKFTAHSEGELRDNTLATTSFRDGRAIQFLGMGKERTGSNFKIDYATKEINFGGSGGVQPLAYTAVYDYLSAMAYLQALLQQHPAQARAGNTLQLPIGKRTVVEMATVSFKPVEQISTYEGAFEAHPASIKIPSGSIQSIDVWFVAEKNYRPLQIELGFSSGKVKLISRKSS